jgi:hypothetical protein
VQRFERPPGGALGGDQPHRREGLALSSLRKGN